MIKKIPIAELKPGMYLHDVNCSWRIEPLFLHRYKVAEDSQIERIRDLGAREVYIDTTLGDDLPGAPTEVEVRQVLEEEMLRLAECGEIPVHYRLSSAEELDRAIDVHNDASHLIGELMTDVRLGGQVELESITEALESITDSVLSNFGTLIQLRQLKNKDDYTFQHSVGVCALLTAFCRVLELNRETNYDVGIGALLHDIGKMRVPYEILNKPGRLTESEFEEVKQHVAYGCEIVSGVAWVSPAALSVLSQHHERYDGTGYPGRLKGAEISYLGQMAAIVDVYDAITAERVYHKAMSPAEALRKLQEWSRFHFNEDLVAHFIRSLGIYPVRTVVRLESGVAGIVIDQNPANLARPVLMAVYDTKTYHALTPYRLDLEKSSEDRILGYELPEKYGIDVDRYIGEAAVSV